MIDAELAAMLEWLPKIDLSDPVAARAAFEAVLTEVGIDVPGVEALDITDRTVPGWKGDPEVGVRIFAPMERTGPVAGVVQIHGGGFIIGSVQAEHAGSALMALQTGSVVVSVEYRLAPEHPYPAALHDCYAALEYLHGHAAELGVDPARLAVC